MDGKPEATPEEKFKLIQEMTQRDSNELNISWLCEMAIVSRSGYYNWLRSSDRRSSEEEKDRADFELILEAYKYRGYDKGRRGIYMRLLHTGIRMNQKKISRLMKKYNLFCPIRKANPFRRMAKALKTDAVSDNLVKREFTEHGANLRTDAILHSDQGCHYTSISFRKLLKDKELRQSMSRRGNCWDNAPQESFFGHMKDEIDLEGCRTYEDLLVVIDDYMDYYNNERYQWELAKLSPNQYAEYLRTGQHPLTF